MMLYFIIVGYYCWLLLGLLFIALYVIITYTAELMGAHVRIIVGLTHLLVVERSYFIYVYFSVHHTNTHISRGKLRCKLTYLLNRFFVQFTHSIH